MPMGVVMGDFKRNAGLFKGSKGSIGNEGAVLFIFSSADIENFVAKRRFGSVEDGKDSVGDFGTDAVAFEYGNCLHGYLPFGEYNP